MTTIKATVNPNFKRRPIEDVLETLTQAEMAVRASDNIREDCFKQHVANVHEDASWNSATSQYLKIEEAEAYFQRLSEMEQNRILTAYFRGKSWDSMTKQEKKDYHKKTGPFRSMKSVVIGAITAGTPLVDDEGYPLGKTALQTAIKEAKSPEGRLFELFNRIEKLIPKLPEDSAIVKHASRRADEIAKMLDDRYEMVRQINERKAA